MKLPKGMWPRVVKADPKGRVEQIVLRPKKREATLYADRWTPGTEDHARKGGKRAVTLIQREHIGVMEQLLGRPVDPLLLRRNIVVSGFNLAAVDGRTFRVGELVLEGTELCHPCQQMVRALGPDGYTAMLGHGGLCARIVHHGTVRVGDVISLAEEVSS